MKIFKELKSYTSSTPLALSIGMFDGVHLGHQKIISDLKEKAREKNLETAVLSFWPHPRLALNPNEDLKMLNTIEEKTALLGSFGIETVFLQEFNEDFRNLSGEEFVRKILIDTLNVKYLIVGYDHVFGKNRSGNFELLQKLAPELNFEVKKTDAVNFDGENISSTKIRNLISEGELPLANAMLGYSYAVSGTVVHGKKLGRTIGYPTANIDYSAIKLLPKKSAYITDVFIHGQHYKGMTSVGTNPTVNGSALTTEVYILDFAQDIYGKDITLNFRERLHDEIKFDSLDKLIDKLNEDRRLTELYFSKNGI